MGDALDDIAAETGKTIPQIALNWLLQRPTVSTVLMIGARNEEQLRQNLGAVGWTLTQERVARLDAAATSRRLIPTTRTGTGNTPNAIRHRSRCQFPDHREHA